jgi:ribose/xylose/arabinose/galactoside ABC-type transport system permease subunit
VLAPEAVQSTVEPVGWGIISVAVAGTVLVGFLIGSLHAWLITAVRLPPFVATLATLVGLRSLGRATVEMVTRWRLGSARFQIQVSDEQFRYLANSIWIPATIFAVLALLLWVMMSRTVVGRHLYALGGNEEAARLSGIRTERLKWLAYVIGAVLSSIAGILYVGSGGAASPQTLGRGYELNAIAAAVVGGCSLQGGIGTISGTVLGVLFLRCVIDGISKVIEARSDVFEGMVVGVLVVVAVALSHTSGIGRRRYFSGALGIVAGAILVALAAVLVTYGVDGRTGLFAGGVVLVLVVLQMVLERWRLAAAEQPKR